MAPAAGPIRYRDPYADTHEIDAGQYNNGEPYATAQSFSPPVQQPRYHTEHDAYHNTYHNTAAGVSSTLDGAGPLDASGIPQPSHPDSRLQVLCGPLLNFLHLTYSPQPVWRGTVLIVTNPRSDDTPPTLTYRPVEHNQDSQQGRVEALKLYQDPDKTFWRFSLDLPLQQQETAWQYNIPGLQFLSRLRDNGPTRTFFLPAVHESMRIMFHSCNGFSVGTDEDYWNGPALWNDVLRKHEQRPFHVMIGGGDQIYNDSVRVNGPLKPWTDIGNPHKRRTYPFDNRMRADCDMYYFNNYVRWYSTEPFAAANASIPQINIWDDHDIIDGFGSYTDRFMKCAVFRGIGGVSFKYYCLFQHHTAPPVSTFTTDAPQTMSAGVSGTARADPRQLQDTYVYERTADDPSWIVGDSPGPYVEERSRSLYMRLGARIAFCGIDARTERTRHQVNYPATYHKIFARLEKELYEADGMIKHLIILLGVPIAYPRLAWLEQLFDSPLLAPLHLLNKRFGFGGEFFNSFDGQVDLLDDLDDHYTAKHHKKERFELIVRLQQLARDFNVRVTILGGDVHLAAVGRFYGQKHPDAVSDPRYMANVISSAITNKPPPKLVANMLAKRNRIHHLNKHDRTTTNMHHDHDATDETLLKMFDKQPGGVMKSSDSNKVTMPSRNYACITEIPDTSTGHAETVNGVTGALRQTNGHQFKNGDLDDSKVYKVGDSQRGHGPLHVGEEEAGTRHPAADGVSSQGPCPGGLNVSIQVEIDNQNPDGVTQGYGLSSEYRRTWNVQRAKC